jgi:hypothetical protein
MAYDTSRYNGWTNYATWRVNLEIFDGLDLVDFFDDKPELSTATEWCEEHVQNHLEEQGSGLVLDYALAFISDVNWREIAQHLINDAAYPTTDGEEE